MKGKSIFILVILVFSFFSCNGGGVENPEVSFDSNGGSSVKKAVVESGSKLKQPEIPVRENYSFVAWYSDKELNNVYDFSSEVTSSFTLYAKWERIIYTISFNTNEGSSIDNSSVGSGLLLEKPDNPTREDYNFIDWYVDEELNTVYDFSTVVKSSFTLYAKWDLIYYTVNYVVDSEASSVDAGSCPSGDLLVKPDDPTFYSFPFEGWFKEEDFTTEWDFDIDTMPSENLTLYAKFNLSLSVSFDTRGLNSVDPVSVDYRDPIPQPADPSIENYPNEGWYKDADYTELWDFATDTMPKNNITIYAKMLGSPKVVSHYYDKGTFDPAFTDYDNAFSDNHTDENVDCAAWIVIELSRDVNPETVTADNLVVKRVIPELADSMFDDSEENNNNIISGDIELSDDNKIIYFKPILKPYIPANSSTVTNSLKPNYNALKPNYDYSVTLSENIKGGPDLAVVQDENSAWQFKTSTLDFGLYWFKDGSNGVKYVPGRDYPSEYYDPNKDTFIFSHGWQPFSIAQDYARQFFVHYTRDEDFKGNPGMDAPVDCVEIWKTGGRDWNFGGYFWNQFAAEGIMPPPTLAESKIWNTELNKYKVFDYKGSVSDIDAEYEYLSCGEALGAICASALSDMDRTKEFRLAGHSLGNQIVHAASYYLLKNSSDLVPDRLTLLDPYWSNKVLSSTYWDGHCFEDIKDFAVSFRESDKTIDEGDNPYNQDYSGVAWVGEMSRAIELKILEEKPDFVVEFYDGSQSCDGKAGIWAGDWSVQVRDIAAISYIVTPWINVREDLGKIMLDAALKHNNMFPYYFWSMAFDAPSVGISAATPTATVRAMMNNKKATVAERGRYNLIEGKDTATPEDDVFEYTQTRQRYGTLINPHYYSPSWQQ